jgi:UDP-2,4-diacetamido-2,4,6-trideoxy-beta-L-altropyranose hydrolase
VGEPPVTAARIAFRVDSSAQMGSGHLMRCLTLANELRDSGATVNFLSRQHPGHLIQLLESQGYSVLRLIAPAVTNTAVGEDYAAWLGVSQTADASETLQYLARESPDWLVVDHYGLNCEWERQMRSAVGRILTIDDLANRRHDCDVLLDQNYFGSTTQQRYAGLTEGESCRLLLGPRYALLQPEYRMMRPLAPPRDGIVRRVLVFFGGSDAANDTGRVLEALSCVELAELAVDVVVGQNHPDRGALRAWVDGRRGASLYSGLPSLAGLMVRADLTIGGGGSTTWERACLSLPAVVATLAENQRGFSEALAADGYQVLLGDHASVSVSQWREALVRLIQDPFGLVELSRRVASLTDGQGALRVATAMFEHERTKRKSRGVASATVVEPAREAPSVASRLRITVLSDSNSWLNQYIEDFVAHWINAGHRVHWVHEPAVIPSGEVCFIIGCSQLLKPDALSRNLYNLVVHESALPEGRGWSPMTWQVLEDRRRIVVSLFEATPEVVAGRIHLQATINLDGSELIEEWRDLQAQATGELCSRWIDGYPGVIANATEQVGKPSFYARRRPVDSRLDPAASLAQQFDLLRTVDNSRYPAYFEYRGRRYMLLIQPDDARASR